MESVQDPKTELHDRRKQAQLTQDAAAKLLGCSEDMLGMIERGDRDPGRRLANRIKEHFGIPTERWDQAEDARKGKKAAAKPRRRGRKKAA